MTLTVSRSCLVPVDRRKLTCVAGDQGHGVLLPNTAATEVEMMYLIWGPSHNGPPRRFVHHGGETQSFIRVVECPTRRQPCPLASWPRRKGPQEGGGSAEVRVSFHAVR